MKQMETNVAVIAGGTAGLAAAIAAAERGVKVIVFEKQKTTGGTGNMGMGPLAVESRLQRNKQMALTREEAFRIFMDYTHWRVDARLVKAYIDKSASTIDWLEEMGVEFTEAASNFPGSHFTWHLVKPAVGRPGPQATATMMKLMTERAKELGVQFLFQTPAKKLVKENGRIVGLIAEDKSDESIQVKAKAVIIATGGFGDNLDMIKKYTGYEWGQDIFSFRIPGMDGDGIKMAWEVGAGQEGLNMEITCGVPTAEAQTASELSRPTALAAFRQPLLLVNLIGERFMNEEVILNPTFTGNAVSRQKERCAFIIFDQDTVKYYEEVGLDCFGNHTFPAEKVENLESVIGKIIEDGNNNYYIVESLEELANQTVINLDNLKKTVNEYNKACETGRDELFHKNAKYLRPVKQPKFYAGRLRPSGYGSLGGIKINHRTEVVTNDHETIPGLYAAGVDACSIYADSYVFVLPGNTMGFALNSGRMAGENAAEYAKTC